MGNTNLDNTVLDVKYYTKLLFNASFDDVPEKYQQLSLHEYLLLSNKLSMDKNVSDEKRYLPLAQNVRYEQQKLLLDDILKIMQKDPSASVEKIFANYTRIAERAKDLGQKHIIYLSLDKVIEPERYAKDMSEQFFAVMNNNLIGKDNILSFTRDNKEKSMPLETAIKIWYYVRVWPINEVLKTTKTKEIKSPSAEEIKSC